MKENNWTIVCWGHEAKGTDRVILWNEGVTSEDFTCLGQERFAAEKRHGNAMIVRWSQKDITVRQARALAEKRAWGEHIMLSYTANDAVGPHHRDYCASIGAARRRAHKLVREVFSAPRIWVPDHRAEDDGHPAWMPAADAGFDVSSGFPRGTT